MRYVGRGRLFLVHAMALLFVAVLAGVVCPLRAMAEGVTVRTGSASVSPGATFELPVTIEGNPGILGATVQVSYPDGLTLTAARSGDAFSSLAMTKPGSLASPCKFTWDGVELSGDIKDGEILVLTFSASEEVASGSELDVVVFADEGSFLDGDLSSVPVTFVSGKVKVTNYIPGDADGDNIVNSRDVIYARRHIVGGYNQKINVPAIDVNDDLQINSGDVILMRRFIAGGYNVELKPSRLTGNPDEPSGDEHKHSSEYVAGQNPTCTEDGWTSYWKCKECGLIFSDANCTVEIKQSDTAIPSPGHTPVVDPAVASTRTSSGLTEGSHCSVCGKVLKEQQVTPPLSADEFCITYDVANGDPYIAGANVNNPNRTSYFEGDSFKISDIECPGYRFLGWYDGAGNDSNKVVRIETGTAEDLKLYAHWEKIQFTVQFESDLLLDSDSATYTVDRGLVLPTPKLSNYIFVGWAGESGNMYPGKIPVGTTGNLTLKANWTSERNKTYTKPNPRDPMVVEDEDTNTILLTYEIGRMENVPLYTIHDFGYINGDGVTKSATETYSTTISESAAESVASAVAKATTKSSNWVLSSGWNEVTSFDQEWGREHNVTEEQCKTRVETNSENWNVSSSSFGSSSSSKTSNNADGWTNENKVNGSDESSTSKNSKVAGELSAKIGTSGPVVDASVEAKISAEKSRTDATKETNGFESGTVDSHTGSLEEASSSSSGWNTGSSRGGSHSVSESESVRKAVSDTISEKFRNSHSVGYCGSESQGFALSDTGSETNEYTAASTWNTSTKAEQTNSWTSAATKAGYHRWVVAGTAHVFGVVGYDISAKSFFVSTFTTIDDETHEFEDYSLTSAKFDDNENGVIPFIVPYDEVVRNVEDRVGASDGLQVDLATGVVTKYRGSDTCVVIPEYYNAGENDVVKITGIASDAFAGNTSIKSVVLSDYISSIPDDAFSGCSSLEVVEGKGVTEIGKRAFAGCTSIEEAGVFLKNTSVGEGAFEGIEKLFVNAANKDVAAACLRSGARSVQLNLGCINGDTEALANTELQAPSALDYVGIDADGRTFNGMTIKSDAGETVLNKIAINGTSTLPVKISSPKVTLNQSTITSPGIALALVGNSTRVGLRGTTTVSSGGEIAMLSRNASFYETANNVVGKLVINQGLRVWGAIDGTSLVNCSDIKTIDEATFNMLLNPCSVTFDPNGGTCAEATRLVTNGMPVGHLPVPTKDYCTFDGWFLAPEGTEVTSSTILPVAQGHTLVAHWSDNPLSDWTKESEVPEDAVPVEAKWTYRQNFYRQEPDAYVYYRWCSHYDNIWNQDSCWVNGTSEYHEFVTATPLQQQPNRFPDMGGNPGGICGPAGGCAHKTPDQSYWWFKEIRYRTVFDRTESAESATEPSGDDVFEVQKWVKYRPRVVTQMQPQNAAGSVAGGANA